MKIIKYTFYSLLTFVVFLGLTFIGVYYFIFSNKQDCYSESEILLKTESFFIKRVQYDCSAISSNTFLELESFNGDSIKLFNLNSVLKFDKLDLVSDKEIRIRCEDHKDFQNFKTIKGIKIFVSDSCNNQQKNIVMPDMPTL